MLVVFLLIVVLAVVLIAGGLFLSRRGRRTDGLARGDAPGAAARAPPAAPSAPPEVADAPTRRADGRRTRGRAPRSTRRSSGSSGRGCATGWARPAPRSPARSPSRRGKIDPETWDELEEALLLADVGMPTTQRILEDVKARARPRRPPIRTGARAAQGGAGHAARAAATASCATATRAERLDVRRRERRGEDHHDRQARPARGRRGPRVVLAAADTFRAAAADQLGCGPSAPAPTSCAARTAPTRARSCSTR